MSDNQEIQLTERISLIEADITELKVDAIVNAANESLLGGGGVDGQIHRVAGPGLLEECRKLSGCPTGQAKITAGYNLPAKWVIHTPGPIWRGGDYQEDTLLASCYRNSLKLAVKYEAKTVAFPMISTGIYKFPPARALKIAIQEIKQFLATDKFINNVYIVSYRKAPTDIMKLLE
jgi:O-acetyl-ADP-ribose deacetylase (regulator of RNase III)